MPMTVFSSLRSRLLLLIVLAVVPVFGILVYSNLEARKKEAAHVQNTALRVARVVIIQQRDFIDGARQLLPTLAQLPSVRTPGDGQGCSRALGELLTRYPYYANFGVIGLDGRIVCSALPFEGAVQLSDRSYFLRALETGDFAVGDYQVGRITGKSSINFGYPVRDRQGLTGGVVFAAFDLTWLNRQLTAFGLPEGTTVTVLNDAGTVLARHPSGTGWIGRSARDEPITRIILETAGEGTAESKDAAGAARLYAFAPLHKGAADSVYVSVGIPRTVAYEELNRVLVRNLAILLLVVAIVTMVAWVGGTLLVLRPLNGLARASERLGAGDFTVRADLSSSPTEFRRLARTFNHMAASLQRRQQEIDTQDRELVRINQALQTLSMVNHVLVRADSETWLLEEMCRVAVELGGYRIAWVGYAHNDEQKSVRPMAWAGIERSVIDNLKVSWADTERGRGPTGTAIRTGEACVVHELQTEPRYRAWYNTAHEYNLNASASLPLTTGGETFGALTVYTTETAAFSAREIDILCEMAEDLAYGIATLRARVRQEQAEATIHRMAYYDALTGLPNHASLEERLKECIAEAEAGQLTFALLFFDLDRLRDFNESLGLEAGNTIMRESAHRMRQACKPTEFIARMRGDEFAVLLPGADRKYARHKALELLRILEKPFALDKLSLSISASAGIVLFPEHAATAERLTLLADLTVRLAKTSGTNYAFYSPALDTTQHKKRRLALAGELRRALDNGGLTLFYQPKIDMRSGRICGFEALCRWPHPAQGMVPCEEFIPLAERTGMIRMLNDWVLETALCRQHRWGQSGLTLPIAVNLSTRNLQDPQLPEKVEALCKQWNIGRGMLEFEITESAIMEDPAGALEILTHLKALGIALSIDDFGTGYSSLGYLKRLPVDTIKIDKSFVIDMNRDKDSATIVQSTIRLAHDLGLDVVAEGVENETVWTRLEELGCDAAQGHYMGRPMPADEVMVWLETSRWGAGRPVE